MFHNPNLADENLACEVLQHGQWKPVGARLAHHAHRDDLKRCPSCHCRVRTMGTYTVNIVRVTIGHIKPTAPCPLRHKPHKRLRG